MSAVTGKVAFVTGGARGIGFSMMTNLLKNNVKGVAIVDISQETANKALAEVGKNFDKSKVIVIKCNVAKKKELKDAFERTVNHFKQLDIVINNAGIVNEQDWDLTVSINLSAVVNGCMLAMEEYFPKYKSEDEAIIVNTASVLGFTTIQSGAFYCTTKHALIGLGRSLGGPCFYKNYKTRVLTICPGLVATSMTAEVPDALLRFPEVAHDEIFNLNNIMQSPEYVGEALIEVINRGKTGSLWITEDKKPVYEIEVPHFRTMKV